MQIITANEAPADLPYLLDRTAITHEPITITTATHSAVLVAQEDWEAIQETLHLLTIPAMRESIREGLETPLEQCGMELDWWVGV